MKVICLVGGMGTRLRKEVSDRPKPMANINGKPFISYILERLEKTGVYDVILATGYMSEVISTYFGNQFNGIKISYSDECTPLGTGGAIRKACQNIDDEYCLVINGDTIFDINFTDHYERAISLKSDVVLALHKVEKNNRYGEVKFNSDGSLIFSALHSNNEALINTGIYVIRTSIFSKFDLPEIFSFEKDLLESEHELLSISSFEYDAYFIDIGIVDDYKRAIKELK